MYGSSPRTTPELRKMEQGERTSVEVEGFAKHIKHLHEDVYAHITKMNQQYKARANQRSRQKEFQVGDLLMVHLRKERFPVGTYNKLKMKKFGPTKFSRNMTQEMHMKWSCQMGFTFILSSTLQT